MYNRKLLIGLMFCVIAIYVLVMAIMTAHAFGDNYENYGIDGDKNHHNTIIGGDYNEGIEGDVSNTNINANINANKNINKNINVNDLSNKNTNFVTQGQGQGQEQGQAQGQLQGQAMGQSLKNKVDINQVFEDKRDHLRGPEVVEPRVKFRDGKARRAKVVGYALLDAISEISWVQARKLGWSARDFKVKEAILFENDFTTDRVRKGKSGVIMGYVYVLSSGPDSNASSAIGRMAERAMKLGATHFVVVAKTWIEETTGSAFNIGIGGGASVLTQGDKTAIAPNGGLGYGRAWTSNELRPDLVAEIYFDEAYIKN